MYDVSFFRKVLILLSDMSKPISFIHVLFIMSFVLMTCVINRIGVCYWLKFLVIAVLLFWLPVCIAKEIIVKRLCSISKLYD